MDLVRNERVLFGSNGRLVPYLPRANSNKKNTNDATKNQAIMKPMNCAPVWPVPGAVELSTAFRVKVFPKDRVEKDVDVGVVKKKGMKVERETAVAATTNTTVNPIIQDAKKTFLEESGAIAGPHQEKDGRQCRYRR